MSVIPASGGLAIRHLKSTFITSLTADGGYLCRRDFTLKLPILVECDPAGVKDSSRPLCKASELGIRIELASIGQP